MREAAVSVGVEMETLARSALSGRVERIRERLDDALGRARHPFGGRPRPTDGSEPTATTVATLVDARFGGPEQLRRAVANGDVAANSLYEAWVDEVVGQARQRGLDPLTRHYATTEDTMRRLAEIDERVIEPILERAFQRCVPSVSPHIVLFDSSTTTPREVLEHRDWTSVVRPRDSVIVIDRAMLIQTLDTARMVEHPAVLTPFEAESLIVDELAIVAARMASRAFMTRAHVVLDTSIASLLHAPDTIATDAHHAGYSGVSVHHLGHGVRLGRFVDGRSVVPASPEERESVALARQVASLRYGPSGEGGLTNLFTEIDGLRARMARIERAAHILSDWSRAWRARHRHHGAEIGVPVPSSLGIEVPV